MTKITVSLSLVFLVTSFSGCAFQGGSNPTFSPAPSAVVEVTPASTVEETPLSSPTTTPEPSVTWAPRETPKPLLSDIFPPSQPVTDNIQVPQIYLDYIMNNDLVADDIKSNGIINGIFYYGTADLDSDGSTEAVIAYGYKDKEPTQSHVYQIIVLRNTNGQIELLNNDFPQNTQGGYVGGYGVNDVKIVSIKGYPQRVVYLGLTNGVGLEGFALYGFSDGKGTQIAYSASATGAGDDELTDPDEKGEYSGYTVHRWSYDVLYYHTVMFYEFTNGMPTLVSSTIDVPDYPMNVRDVIIQYLGLKYVNLYHGPSAEASKRLDEICASQGARDMPIDFGAWYDAVYHTIMGIDNQIQFQIDQQGSAATVTATYVMPDSEIQYGYDFGLKYSAGKWRITSCELI